MFTNSKHEAAHKALKKGDIDKAIFLYTEALNAAPNDCDILSDRATAFLHKKDKLRSMADFNKAVELDPNYSFRYAARAFAKQNFGDLDGAVEDYRKAVDLDPEDAVAQNNLGMLLEQQGYKKEADERFARADKLSKMEDQLYDVIEDLERGDPEVKGVDEAELTKEFEARTQKAEKDSGEKGPSDSLDGEDKRIQPEEKQDKKSNAGGELKKVFTSRQQFREFVRFIRNGFKLK